MKIKKVVKPIVMVVGVIIATLLFFIILGAVANATGLVDDTVNAANKYSEYPLENYQLDYYVDESWDWLPWNWGEGVSNNLYTGLYMFTNIIWTFSKTISSATGYLVQEAYELNFISDTADYVGKNMQTLAGVSPSGISGGFYSGMLGILILIVGAYVAYVGLAKRQLTRAISAALNFVLVFVISAGFIAYAPSYINKINDFSTDVSQGVLDLGSKMVMSGTSNSGSDSVTTLRDNLFSIQIMTPYLLLQYGTADIDQIGEDRINELLEISPDENNGEDREDKAKDEVNDEDNQNMSISKTASRFGTVIFIFVLNLIISAFVILLTLAMLMSQLLFIVFAMFLPISFLISMIPGYEHTAKKAIEKLFNTIITRAGITLVITIAFCLSGMFYNLTIGKPFFLMAILQILVYWVIWTKLGDILSMFGLQGGMQSVGSSGRAMRDARRAAYGTKRTVQKTGKLVLGAAAGAAGLYAYVRGKGKNSTDGKVSMQSNASRKTAASDTPKKNGDTRKDNLNKNSDVDNQKKNADAEKRKPTAENQNATDTLKKGNIPEQNKNNKGQERKQATDNVDNKVSDAHKNNTEKVNHNQNLAQKRKEYSERQKHEKPTTQSNKSNSNRVSERHDASYGYSSVSSNTNSSSLRMPGDLGTDSFSDRRKFKSEEKRLKKEIKRADKEAVEKRKKGR